MPKIAKSRTSRQVAATEKRFQTVNEKGQDFYSLVLQAVNCFFVLVFGGKV
jgi:hypothetical protein